MQIFVRRNHKELGPYSREILKEGIELGAFSPDEFARTADMSEYKSLGEILNAPPKAAGVPKASHRPVKVLRRPIAGVPVASPAPKRRSPVLAGVIAAAVVASGLYIAYSPDAAGVRSSLTSTIGKYLAPSKTAGHRATPVPAGASIARVEPQATPVPDPSVPAPEVTPATPPEPPAFDLAALAGSPAEWPKVLRLLEPVEFPAVVDGLPVGTVKVPRGAAVTLIKISGENLTLDFHGGQTGVSWKKTNIEQASAEAAKLLAANPAPASAAPRSAEVSSTPPAFRKQTAYGGPNFGLVDVDTSSLPELAELNRALRLADYKFTPEVKSAYMRATKAKVLRQVTNSRVRLPDSFLYWVDSDPIVSATVYGSRKDSAGILCMLRSLELDLGEDVVRRDYTQLALAMAVVEANAGATANLSPRKPIQLTIPGDPRKPVDTHAKDRPLDLNDHIINFLEDHPPIEVEPFNVPHFKENARGVAMVTPVKAPKRNSDDKVKRSVVAADVLESKQLQDEFNAYMAAHGQTIRIDCGDHVIWPNMVEAVSGQYSEGIMNAYRMFRTAYEAKGRLPESRDQFPTAAERCAFIIRNDSHFPSAKEAQRKWDRFPVKSAPWPTMTLLAQNTDPLREREEIWQRFDTRGEAITYGEYTGGIAQQSDYQAARRLTPYPFTYGTFQMMLKDGGVCGTMANMGTRTNIALGSPSSTAGQPGHCALITFAKDQKTHFFNCHGEQYVSAGDEGTHPHAKWIFADGDSGRPMVWHQSVAYAVNAGFQSYLDSMMALNLYKNLPPDVRKTKGLSLLQSGLALNRYNIALVDLAAADPDAKTFLGEVAESLRKSLSDHGGTAACPSKGLYMDTVMELLGVPVPKKEPKKESKRKSKKDSTTEIAPDSTKET